MKKEKTPFNLAAVPNVMHDLSIKATYSGIVLLKQGRYKKRYTGSKTSIVDINGNLYLRRKDMPIEVTPENKKRPPKTPIMERPAISYEGNKDNENQLSTNKPASRGYCVNKVEVRNRINAMIQTRQGKKELYFWTVTFPPSITDQLCYQALNTWLTQLRQLKMLRNYLWIAERQTGERKTDGGQPTNTIHFHLAIPHRMDVFKANKLMRTVLTTFAKKGLMNYSRYQAKHYNGVDIAKNRKTRRVTNFAIKKGYRALSYYLAKYVTKNDATFNHLAWHNSRGYSALFTGVTFTKSEFIAGGCYQYINRKSIINNEFFMFFAWLNDPPAKLIGHLAELNSYVADRLN